MTVHDSRAETSVTQIAQTRKGTRMEVVVEAPIAMSFNGTTAAVMRGTPSDLRDLAYGFALTEGYLTSLSEVESFEELRHEEGYEARFWVTPERADAIAARRRAMAGPVGCGLCGLESLQEVMQPLPVVRAPLRLTDGDITKAMHDLYAWQPLKHRTRSTHAAGFYVPGQGIIAAREDVGRHNALDKLIGHLAQTGQSGAQGAIVMTSRISLELVQKTAIFGTPMLIAASGPTSLAIDTAKASGISLIGFCRGSDHEAFC
ncbi:MAG: formate dehydrogenase accessory sulfurtransferase FdhD [Pseudomonadota bacterium]